MLKNILVFVGLLFLTVVSNGGSCGDSGSSDTTSKGSSRSYSLDKLGLTTVGTSFNIRLTGSDNTGEKYSGSLRVYTGNMEKYEGTMANTLYSILNLGPFKITTTSYFDTSNGNFLGQIIQPTDVECMPETPHRFPSAVKVGDFATIPDSYCSNDTILSSTWKAEDGGNGNIKLIQTGTTRDQFTNVTKGYSTTTMYINGDGDIVGFNAGSMDYDTGFALSYRSDGSIN